MFLDVISCTGIAKNTLDFVNKQYFRLVQFKV